MKMLMLILNKTDVMEDLLHAFADGGVRGATILDSIGMARAIGDYRDGLFLGALTRLLDPDADENKTLFTVVRDDQVQHVLDIITSVVGDLDQPDTGIVFTMPIEYLKGIPSDIGESS